MKSAPIVGRRGISRILSRKFFLSFVAGLASVVFVASAYPADSSQQVVKHQGKTTVIELLEPKAAYSMIQKNKDNKDFVLIDVRTSGEFDEGHIDGAININYNSPYFTKELESLDKMKTYLIYCRTGNRSSDSVEIMVKLGFEKIYRIKGDIVSWKSEDLPLVK
jgi:rhodanese-related sulfurtransferase